MLVVLKIIRIYYIIFDKLLLLLKKINVVF